MHNFVTGLNLVLLNKIANRFMMLEKIVKLQKSGSEHCDVTKKPKADIARKSCYCYLSRCHQEWLSFQEFLNERVAEGVTSNLHDFNVARSLGEIVRQLSHCVQER